VKGRRVEGVEEVRVVWWCFGSDVGQKVMLLQVYSFEVTNVNMISTVPVFSPRSPIRLCCDDI